MPLYRAAIALTCLLALFGLVVPAQAFDQTTKWFAIMAQPSGSAPPLFLTYTPDGLIFEPYSSGDTKQMWAAVDVDYPTTPRVTSDSGVDIVGGFGSVLDCFVGVWTGSGGCGFNRTLGKVAKVVSRASRACLVFGPGYNAVTRPCLVNSPDEGYQLWRVSSDNPAAVVFVARSGAGSCLASSGGGGNQMRALASGCSKVPPGGRTSFVLQLAAELSCKTDYYWHICFRQQ